MYWVTIVIENPALLNMLGRMDNVGIEVPVFSLKKEIILYEKLKADVRGII